MQLTAAAVTPIAEQPSRRPAGAAGAAAADAFVMAQIMSEENTHMTHEWEDGRHALLKRFLNNADNYIRKPQIAKLLAFVYARSANEMTLCAACAYGGQETFADRRTFVGIGRELFPGSRKRPDLFLVPFSAAGGKPSDAVLIEVKAPWPGSHFKGEHDDFNKLAEVRWGCVLLLYHSFRSQPPWGGHPRDYWPRRHICSFKTERDAYIQALNRGDPWWRGKVFPFCSDDVHGDAQLMAWLVGTGWDTQ